MSTVPILEMETGGLEELYHPAGHTAIPLRDSNPSSLTAQPSAPTPSSQGSHVSCPGLSFSHPSNGSKSPCWDTTRKAADRELGEPCPLPAHPGAPLPADEKGMYAVPGDTASRAGGSWPPGGSGGRQQQKRMR